MTELSAPSIDASRQHASLLPPMAWGVVSAAALVKLLTQLWAIHGYGIFRDELYYLACADHLDWGYVDHPALSIVILWIVKHLFGTSLVALRIVPALAGAATVVLVAATARVMGGTRIAQALAAVATLIVPIYLAFSHIYSMNALTVLIWAAAAYLLARLIATGEARLWPAIGVVLALGLANKLDVLWLGAGLAVGLVLTPQRRWLATRWPWLAGSLALCGLAPYVWWQTQHDWATREFIHNATTQKMAPVSIGDFLSSQIMTMHPLTLPLWLGGLVFLMVHPKGKQFRLLGWVFLTVAAILLVSGTSRAGYLSPGYTWLFAAGGVAAATLVTRWRCEWAAWVAMVLMLIGGAATAPLALPLLPVECYVRYAAALGIEPSTEEKKDLGALPQFYADMHGWSEIAQAVIEVVNSLPEQDRVRARVFARNYGVAGAIDYYGRGAGLAKALSGHNNYWYWGPGTFDGAVLVEIGGSRDDLEKLFDSVELAATIDCGLCMPYENHASVWVCRGLKPAVGDAWQRAKHFD